jgi:hypothetical protein
LLCEELERRLVLSTLVIPVQIPYGDQVVTVQAYNDPSRTAFGIFDTGSSAITFSAQDQASFKAKGNPIPIKVPGGAVLDGVGGLITGDVSQPGTILAAGLSSVTMSVSSNGSTSFTSSFTNGYAAATPGIQAFVGTPNGSPTLPTLTGAPILTGGYAALIDMQGASFDFSSFDPGLQLTLPDLKFVSPGFQLNGGPTTTVPITIPLSPFSGGQNPASSVTEAPTSVDDAVTLVAGSASVSGKTFLFDTGAQVTAISTETAVALGLDLAHPTGWGPVQGVGGTEEVPNYTLDQLDLPFAGGTLELTNVPVAVVNVAAGLDGVLGMNLWHSAVQLLYTPQALQVTFHTNLVPPAEGFGGIASILQSHGVPFANAADGHQLPGLGLSGSGQISGQAFYDWNRNGVRDSSEAGLAGVSVYLDLNNDGQWDNGEPITTTDASGFYHFGSLVPGNYQVREIGLPGMLLTNSGVANAVLLPDSSTSGVNFGNIPHYADFNDNYLTHLYGDLLDRAPDSAGFQAWLNLLQQGTTTQQVADAFWQSAEHRRLQVMNYYQTLLHRAADPAGLQAWVNAFLAGASEKDIQLGMLSSAEYQASHPDSASYVESLYLDVLGRNADSAGASAWEQLLNQGLTRVQAAAQILTSTESYRRQVEGLYASLLHRPADAAGEQAWVTLLAQNQAALDEVAEAFLDSSEYLSSASR